MSFTHSSIAWSTKQISAMVKSGKINLNHIIQRSDVWEKARKSLLIHSIIMEVPVPALYAKKIVGDPKKFEEIIHIWYWMAHRGVIRFRNF